MTVFALGIEDAHRPAPAGLGRAVEVAEIADRPLLSGISTVQRRSPYVSLSFQDDERAREAENRRIGGGWFVGAGTGVLKIRQQVTEAGIKLRSVGTPLAGAVIVAGTSIELVGVGIVAYGGYLLKTPQPMAAPVPLADILR